MMMNLNGCGRFPLGFFQTNLAGWIAELVSVSALSWCLITSFLLAAPQLWVPMFLPLSSGPVSFFYIDRSKHSSKYRNPIASICVTKMISPIIQNINVQNKSIGDVSHVDMGQNRSPVGPQHFVLL